MNTVSKQDGVYPRTPSALAQQYDFGKVFDEITGIKLTVEEQEAMMEAELSLKLGYDDNDQIVSMLNASANIITIRGNRLTIESDHFTLTANGIIHATAGEFSGTVTATAGEIGGCVIKDGVLQIKAANIAEKLTAEQIDTQQFTAEIAKIEKRVGATETSLTVLSGQIESKVSQTDFDTLTGRVSTAEGKITTLAGQISLKVSQKDFDELSGEVTTISGELSLKIDANNLVSTLNATADKVSISSDRFELTGSEDGVWWKNGDLQSETIHATNALTAGDTAQYNFFQADDDGVRIGNHIILRNVDHDGDTNYTGVIECDEIKLSSLMDELGAEINNLKERVTALEKG